MKVDMKIPAKSLEPLADYVEPKFGNIYDFDIDAGVEELTELRHVIQYFLLFVAAGKLRDAALAELGAVEGGDLQWLMKAVTARFQGWEIAHAFHVAAVKAVLSLDEIVGPVKSWRDASHQDDVAVWLDSRKRGATGYSSSARLASRPNSARFFVSACATGP